MKRIAAVHNAVMEAFQDFIDEKDLGIILEGTDDTSSKEISRLQERIGVILRPVLKFTDIGIEMHPEAITSQEDRLGMLCLLIEALEDTLQALGIDDIENDEKEDDEGASMIYGTDYGDLEQALSDALVEHGCLFDEQYYLDQSQSASTSAPSKNPAKEQTLVITIGFSDMSRENILIRTSGKNAEKAKELIIKAYEDWQDDKDDPLIPTTSNLEELFEKTLNDHQIPFTTEDFDVIAFDLE